MFHKPALWIEVRCHALEESDAQLREVLLCNMKCKEVQFPFLLIDNPTSWNVRLSSDKALRYHLGALWNAKIGQTSRCSFDQIAGQEM